MVLRYLLSAALVLAAHARADLLAGGADADVGLPADSTSSQNAGFFARAGGVFIGAVLLWDILFRGQLGFSISFLEEMWARNLGNLMISAAAAVRVRRRADDHEHRAAGDRHGAGLAPGDRLLRLQPVGLGFALAAFFVNLILTSWAVGIVVSGFVLRNGMGAESLAWTIMFLFMPLTCVYYPVRCCRDWLQIVAWSLPPTYVFEGMRALLIDHVFRADLMLEALALNAVLFAVAWSLSSSFLTSARVQGSLLQAGE